MCRIIATEDHYDGRGVGTRNKNSTGARRWPRSSPTPKQNRENQTKQNNGKINAYEANLIGNGAGQVFMLIGAVVPAAASSSCDCKVRRVIE